MTLLAEFARVFQLPPAMLPHVEFVAQPQEMALVVALGDGPLTAAQIAAKLELSPGEAEALLHAAYTRSIVNREVVDGRLTYAPASFSERLDPLSMYENWRDVPADARAVVVHWQFEEFVKTWQPEVEVLRADPDKPITIPNRDVLLLDEALAMVEAASEYVVVPCDCRSIVMACDRPCETCIRLDEDAPKTLERGHGRRLTKDQIREVVIKANKAGLMASGDHHWREHGGPSGFCNCCACDCYSFRAGQQLGMSRQWPCSHYVAERDMAKCEQCGKCVRRCHFDAFYHDRTKMIVNGKRRKSVLFEPLKCWGCGLCATTCPDAAITMRPLGTREPGPARLIPLDPDAARREIERYYEMETRSKGGPEKRPNVRTPMAKIIPS
jgi:NAD-dependent dihydropyrimidine dehydrogenase PreA subunit